MSKRAMVRTCRAQVVMREDVIEVKMKKKNKLRQLASTQQRQIEGAMAGSEGRGD